MRRLASLRRTAVHLVLTFVATGACLHAEGRERTPSLLLGTTWFDFGQETQPAWGPQVELRVGRARGPLRGVVSATMTDDSSAFLGAGIGSELAFGRRWVVTPTFVPGYYRRGNGKDLGSSLEFRSQLEVGYQLRDRHRLVLAVSHMSNAGLGRGNPGEESLTLAWEMSLARRHVD